MCKRFQPGEGPAYLVGSFSVIVKTSLNVRCELYWTMWWWVLRGWSVLSTTRPPPVTRSALPTWAPARPSPAGAMSSGHSPANFDRNTQQQPGPGPGSQAAVCDGGDFTTHLSCFTASSGHGADALCVFANLLTTLHTTHTLCRH